MLRANAAPRTFLDKMRLEVGGNFVRDFSSALGKTRIAVVLVSAAALERMTAERLDTACDVRPKPASPRPAAALRTHILLNTSERCTAIRASNATASGGDS